MKNIIRFILSVRIVPTYKVTYAPLDSRNPNLPIQSYVILGHPNKLAWKSKSGNRLFTALSAKNHERFIAFRADRVLSINFSGASILFAKSSTAFSKTLKTSTLPFVPTVA